MSFEEVYEELKALVDEQNPSDVLQFCYDFFGEKLKAERSVFRRGK